MAVSVGIDLVDVCDVEASLDRFGERYLRRVFTPHEIAAAPTIDRAAWFAVCFAAKEAAVKALGVAAEPAPWRGVEVSGCLQRASLALSGEVARAATRLGVGAMSLSIASTPSYAAAVVVVETGCRSSHPEG